MLIILALVSGFFAHRLYHNMIIQVDALLPDEVHEIEPWLSRSQELASLNGLSPAGWTEEGTSRYT
jgi:hypothetical protein